MFKFLALSSLLMGLSPISAVQQEMWLGTAPFCRAAQTDCDKAGMSFVRSHSSGNGQTCLTGEKILCRAAASLSPEIVSACPANATQVTGTLSCNCTGAQTASGNVWGNKTYTDDSSVCKSGVHAGIIPASGGTIRITILPGLKAYSQSSANGVTTSSYGAWKRSFSVSK